MAMNPGSTSGMAGDYNENSDPQLAIINLMTPYIHLGIDELNVSSLPLVIADFGSSHGRNSIIAMKIFIKYLQEKNKFVTSPLVIHNDLPTNDWTKLFQLLSEDKSYHGVANGYSFYEQCLPDNSLSIGFTSSSLHWLSKIPFNIKNHCFHIHADNHERRAYEQQAKIDFNSFIEHRSRELVPGGILVLSIPSFDDQGIDSMSNYFDQLYTCAKSFFNEQELLNLTIPLYLRSLSECMDYELFDRCSLQLIKAELTECKASTRRAVSGLNYCATNDSEVFDNIIELINGLTLDTSERHRLVNNIRKSKQYLKSDFKANVTRTSRVLEHCICFSLSDPMSNSFSVPCSDHEHDQICSECLYLALTLQDINRAIDNSKDDEEEVKRKMYKFTLAYDAIQAWKSHHLRSVNQDSGRESVLDVLGEDAIYLNLDFVMK
ncbi:unnamed protein product [Rotaria sp. Silwood1]|nr:unnamed protein product [Rotaria sp. Silwood1]